MRISTYILWFILYFTYSLVTDLLGQDLKYQLNAIHRLINQGQRETALKSIDLLIESASREKAYGYAIEGYNLWAENRLIDKDSVVEVFSSLEDKALSLESPMKELLALELARKYLNFPTTYQLTKIESTTPFPGELSKYKINPNTKDKEWLRRYAFAWMNVGGTNNNMKNLTDLKFFGFFLDSDLKNNISTVSMFDLILRIRLDLLKDFFPSWSTIPKIIVQDLISFKYEPKFYSENLYIQQWQKDQYTLEEYLSTSNTVYLGYEAFARLMFFKENAVIEDKNELVRSTLGNWQRSYQSDFFTFQLAVNLIQENPKDFKSSLNLISKLTSDEFILKGKELRESILTPKLSLVSPRNQQPGKPILFKMEWRNLSQVYIEVYSLKRSNLRFSRQLYSAELVENEKIHTETIKLVEQESPDLRSAILKTKISFKEGNYRLKVYSSKLDKEEISYIDVKFSNLGFVQITPTDFGFEGIVVNTRTGNPVYGAKVSLSRIYDNTSIIPDESLLSDVNGKIKVIIDTKGYSVDYLVSIVFKGDTIEDRIYITFDFNNYEWSDDNYSYFFTDRIVYKPGQKVQWKMIVVNQPKGSFASPLENKSSISVIFRDPKERYLGEFKVRLNEYSSASGDFLIPENSIPGLYSIETNNGSINFKVEEYKQPKFEVILERPNNNFSIGDEVVINGKVINMNESPVANAKVSYKVYRILRSSPRYRSRSLKSNESFLVSSGSTSVNDNGDFNFLALLNDDISSKLKTRIYDFRIIVDVTDENNETQSDEIYLAAGTSALELDIKGKNEIYQGVNSFEVFLDNLDGASQKGKVFWELKKITKTSPKVNFYHRSENSNDKNDEHVLVVWPFSLLSLSREFPEYSFIKGSEFVSLINSGEFPIDGKSTWKYNFPNESSDYEWLGKSIDQNGKVTEIVKNISVLGNSRYDSGKALRIRLSDSIDGDARMVLVTFSTDLSDRNLFYRIVWLNKILQEGWIKTNNGLAKVEVPFLIIYEGSSIAVSSFVTANGILYESNKSISFPWIKNKLDISLSSLRKKYLAGSQEKFSLKILDYKKNPVKAEVLVGIYDASLVIYGENSWSNNIWRFFKSEANFKGNFKNTNLLSKGSTDVYFQNKLPKFQKSRFYPFDEGSQLSIGRGRSNPVFYYLNGVKISASSKVQSESIEELLDFDSETRIYDNNPKTSPKIRKSFNETSLFIPDKVTDENGNLELEFTMPDASAKWKLLLLAHDTNLASSYLEESLITLKDIMVTPRLPSFVRQGDKLEFKAKVDNGTSSSLDASTTIQILNASNNQDITSIFIPKGKPKISHKVPGLSSFNTSWNIEVPNDFKDSIKVILSTKSGNISDGEEQIIPVLSN
jgi:hypothetical protein